MKIEEVAQEWLEEHNWDYKKYGDKRSDRSAYSTMMLYEISDLLLWAFEEGAKHGMKVSGCPRCT